MLAGDVLITFITADTSLDDGTDTNGGRFVPDPTWTLMAKSAPFPVDNHPGGTARAYCYAKIALGNETGFSWGDTGGVDAEVVALMVTMEGQVDPLTGATGASFPDAAAAQLTSGPHPVAPSLNAVGATTHQLFCSFHEGNTGAVVVTPPPGMNDSGFDTVGFYGTEASGIKVGPGPTGARVASGGTPHMAAISVLVPCIPSKPSSSSSSSSPAPSSSSSSATVTTTCCPGNPLPTVLHATLTDAGGCACLNGLVVVLLFQPPVAGVLTWTGSAAACGSTVVVSVSCANGGVSAGDFGLSGSCAGFGWSIPFQTSGNCNPFAIEWDGVSIAGGNCCAGTFNVRVTV